MSLFTREEMRLLLRGQLRIALPGFYVQVEREGLLQRAVEAMLLAYDLGQEHYIDHIAENTPEPKLGKILTRVNVEGAERVCRELEGAGNHE